MPRPKKDHDLPEVPVRTKMLLAAMGLFSRKGYATTTVREIVMEAGVTKPVLYYYFGNKEGIYRQLMMGPFGEFETLLAQFQKKEGAAKKLLVRLCLRLFALFNDNIEVARIIYSIYYGPPQGAPFIDFDRYHTKLRDTVRQIIADGMKHGEFHKSSLESITWAVMGAITIAMEVQLSHPERAFGSRGLARVLDLILSAVDKRRRCAQSH